MYQPKPLNWKVFLTIPAVFVLLFVSNSASAVDATPSASPSASPSVGVSPSASPSPSNSPNPSTSTSPQPLPTTPSIPGRGLDLSTTSSVTLLVNKQTPLTIIDWLDNPADRATWLRNIPGGRMHKAAAPNFIKLAKAMKAAGAGTLLVNSSFRAYSTQVFIHRNQVARLGLVAGEALAARPGYSEHQTGLAVDVSAAGQGCVIQICFANTKAGKWLAANAWQYGFIIRYPKGQTDYTGYQFEPWHLRYVGVPIAAEMKNLRVAVYERYLRLPAAPTY